MKKLLPILSLVTVWLQGGAAGAAGPAYTVMEIPALPGTEGNAVLPWDINDSGQVVGDSFYPFLFHDANANGTADTGELLNLYDAHGLYRRDYSFSIAINGSGQIAATMDGGGVVLLSQGALTLLDSSPSAYPRAINDSGVVVGTRYTSAGPRATRWHNGSITSLPLSGAGSDAYDINSFGDVAGSMDSRPVLWRNGTAIPLGTLAGSSPTNRWVQTAYAVNDAGQVVGLTELPGGAGHAFLWQNGTMIGLGTLGGTYSDALDINSAGQVVGSSSNGTTMRAYVWTDSNQNGQSDAGEMVDLNSLVDPSRQLSLLFAYAINNRGQIVALGEPAPYDLRGYVLTPAARRPVLIVPGIAGSYALDLNDDTGWIMTRGVDPSLMQIDPLARGYHDIIRTLQNAGYVEGKDLFVVAYDWRLPPGPDDGVIDGTISGLSASSISAGGTYTYAVDYLGEALKRAYNAWEADHPGQPLEEVDIIAHSTGGLVTRTYLQSAAYNGTFAAGDKKLPKVKNFVQVGVPNRGASKAWNPLRDNWIADTAYRVVLSKMVLRAWQKVLAGDEVSGPLEPITLASITVNGQPDPKRFIHLYVPTIRSLLATYNFIDFGSGSGNTNVNSNLSERNTLLLDLNDGLDLRDTADPSPFASRCSAHVIYGTNGGDGGKTAARVWLRTDPAKDVLAPFSDFAASDAQDQVWYEDIWLDTAGDGTVPIESSAGQFLADARVALHSFTQGGNTQFDVGHVQLMHNPDVQKLILQKLGVSFTDSDISTNLHNGAMQAAMASRYTLAGSISLTLDPVDGYIVDGQGRRLGFSQWYGGKLTEVSESVYYGNENGQGWVFGPVAEPLTLELTGRGENYYAMVSVQTDHGSGGTVVSGYLAPGEQRSIPITIGEPVVYKCPEGPGYWKSGPVSWPVTSLTLGSQSYSEPELIAILGLPIGTGHKADASLALAHQLIAARLSIASGSDPAPVAAIMTQADALLSSRTGRLPYAVSPSRSPGQEMASLAELLDQYNSRVATPVCAP